MQHASQSNVRFDQSVVDVVSGYLKRAEQENPTLDQTNQAIEAFLRYCQDKADANGLSRD